MNAARNDNELRDILMPALYEVAEYVADELLKLNEKKIETWVYNRYLPTYYTRSKKGLKKGWSDKVDSAITGEGKGKVRAELNENPARMTLGDAVNGQHAALFDSPKYGKSGHDVRYYVTEIVYEGLYGDVFGSGEWSKPRNAYQQLIKTLGKNSGLPNIIENGMKKAGLNFKVNNRNFTRTET